MTLCDRELNSAPIASSLLPFQFSAREKEEFCTRKVTPVQFFLSTHHVHFPQAGKGEARGQIGVSQP